ncbi:prepilin-type N-terminal cleavage/methylation domain-containing protein [bacterium]|nr:prepilin-type N-terminal cleavage/methylation domain-containing protein [bacterium]
MKGKSGFTLVEIMIVVAIIGLIVAIAVPSFLKSRRDAQGTTCSAQLEQIFSAIEQISFRFAVKPSGAWPAGQPAQVLIDTYLRGFSILDNCPSSGTYAVGATVTDAAGSIIVPTCSLENADPDGDGIVNREEGLHVHQRSLLNGVRNPVFTFAS